MPECAFSFPHGLGDCANMGRLLQLYRWRGYDIAVQSEPNKAALWKAAGVRQVEQAAHHPWPHPQGFDEPGRGELASNKVAGNLDAPPLPPLGDPEALWRDLCESVDVEGRVSDLVDTAARHAADALVAGLPAPVILLHTTGTTWAERKSLPVGHVAPLCELLLETGGSVVVLDWDGRTPCPEHPRVRPLPRPWTLLHLAALCDRADLLIGVDSGPLHFAAWTRLPALGVFHGFHPSSVALPRSRNVYMTQAHHREVNATKRRRWNLVEYAGPVPPPEAIALHAGRMLAGPRYLRSAGALGRDVQMQQWVRDWMRGSTPLARRADRAPTMDRLLCEVGRRFERPRIVETGCVRSAEDWSGAGNATCLLAAYAEATGGSLVSVDNHPGHVTFARQVVQPFQGWGGWVEVEQSCSVAWLNGTPGPIDVLYLDSMDADLPGHAEHGLAEAQAAERRLDPAALVVYDDTVRDGGAWRGKGALGVPYLLGRGWHVLAEGYQVVLSREKS